MRLHWSEGEVGEKLHGIMQSIHSACQRHGESDGQVNYAKGANIASFVSRGGDAGVVQRAPVRQGIPAVRCCFRDSGGPAAR